MNIIYSTYGIVDPRHPAQGLADMSNAGFQNIALDLGMSCSGWDLEIFGKKKKPSHTVLRRDESAGRNGTAGTVLSGNTRSKSNDKVSSIRTPETMLEHFGTLLDKCSRHSLAIRMIRLPRLLWDTKRTDLDPLLEQIAESAIRLCGKINCPYLVVPPLFSGIEKDREWSVNRDYYLRLAKTAQEYHITLLLENQCRSYNGHLIRGICSDGAQAAEWIDQLNAAAKQMNQADPHPAGQPKQTSLNSAKQMDPANPHPAGQPKQAGLISAEQMDSADLRPTRQPEQMDPPPSTRTAATPAFAFCLDAGICTLCGQDMQEFITTLGNRLHAVCLRDSDKNQESSLLPFTAAYQGQPRTDWLSLIRGLRSVGFDGSLLLDFGDTASAFSPLLRPQLLPLARAVADYFQWQIELESLLKKYDSIVLFGAGNMCRNYMKCYGEQYPPLFTCDNNRSIWGTQFCGLEVKPPEALKKLPANCGIFICNIYYREIEKQLQDMGIENIEFFNDEYMPSFHFDRLEV